MARMEHRGLSIWRIKKLIWVGGGYQAGMNCYILHTNGFDGMNKRYEYALFNVAMHDMGMLRERAYYAPQLFPASVLTLGELAKIAYYTTKE